MCGEVEDDKQFDNEVMARFLYIASGHGVTGATIEVPAKAPLTGDGERPAYMSDLFRRALNQAASDLCAVPEGARVETLANQAVVFARLAGFLAGQLPAGEDMTRPLLEALLDGEDEPKRTFARLRERDHGHSHDHEHDHDHDDGHHHHHH
jgi:hypothetical protein